jgi:hypothetical protein
MSVLDAPVAAEPSEARVAGALNPDRYRIPITIALTLGVLALLTTVGADSDWLVALGRIIVRHGGVPHGVPFAATATGHWPNPLALGEIILYGLHAAFGTSGLLAAQLLAVGAAQWVIAVDARAAGARTAAVTSTLLLIAIGALPSLALVRVQLFSLVLFPLIVALLRAEHRRASKRIWLVLPLLAVWSNLHGAVLSGLVLLYAYLVFSRARHQPRTALLLALAAPLAVCVTPAGLHTVDYFRGLVGNLAAQRGVGQWAPLGHDPFDWVLLGVVLVFALRIRRARLRPDLWEAVVILVLTVLSVKAGRDGVWLLFFLAVPAARAARPGRSWNGLLPLGLAAAVLAFAVGAGHWGRVGRTGEAAARQAVALAHGSPVLADALLSEQVAVAGGRIWAGNPLDAFSRSVQARYLDWIAGRAGPRSPLADRRVRVVVAVAGTAAARLTRADHAFVHTTTVGSAEIFTRRQ